MRVFDEIDEQLQSEKMIKGHYEDCEKLGLDPRTTDLSETGFIELARSFRKFIEEQRGKKL